MITIFLLAICSDIVFSDRNITEESYINSGKCPETAKYDITGDKAHDKCLEYAQLVYPCRMKPGNVSQYERQDACVELATPPDAIVFGTEALANEYPHMAALGYSDDGSEIYWNCGGSLISDYFVMTAAHCVYSHKWGRVKLVRLGVHKLSDAIDINQLYPIREIYKHPEYEAPARYNDIALIKLDARVAFSEAVRPACLSVTDRDEGLYIATGWGATSRGGPGSDQLLSVGLIPFSLEECSREFAGERTLKRGILNDSQLCAGAGDYGHSNDACQGDSGGPLQVKNLEPYCTFSIVGIISFGRSCGTAGVPGVYTRVSHFVPWIESIVWP